MRELTGKQKAAEQRIRTRLRNLGEKQGFTGSKLDKFVNDAMKELDKLAEETKSRKGN